jgi:hypothetical protein
MAKCAPPRRPLKRKALDIPPEVARAFMADLEAYHHAFSGFRAACPTAKSVERISL